MSAEVETMVYTSNSENRFFTPWHGLGTAVDHAMTSKEALEMAGLNWNVYQSAINMSVNGSEIDGYLANFRDTDGKCLGIVSDRYKLVQNYEAFDFTDSLVGEGVTYETAGSLFGGKKVWMLAKMPQTEILGDKFEPYICFTNQHDGHGSVQVCMTPIRVVCNNTLNMALESATRSWSSRHSGDMNMKLTEARETLGLAEAYMSNLAKRAEAMATQKMTDTEVKKAIELLMPTSLDFSERKIKTIEENRDVLYSMYIDPNIANFLGTKWGFINAVADYVDHAEPSRQTETFAEKRFDKVISGHKVLDTALQIIA